MSLISSKTMWSGDLEAKAELYNIGADVFELYVSVGGEIPHRHVGSLAVMNSVFDAWCYQRKQGGFIEQLPSFNPDCFRN